VSLVLQGHLLRRANAFDDGTHLHGDGAQSEEIRKIAGEMMPSTHEAVKGWLTGDTRNRVRG